MQKINKNHESSAAKALSQWKKKYPTQTYNDLGETEKGRTLRRDVREALIAEQHCLCAYCTMRITLESSHNEHVIPKGGGCAQPNKQLDYANLVAACEKGGCRCAQTKGSQCIALTPCMKACETELEFRWNGEVRGKTPRAKEAIGILGLNERYLVQRRKVGIDAMLFESGVNDQFDLTDDELLQILREEIMQQDNACLTAFSPVLINILDGF
jgi:uncharacterized protein (TIGR02646 family)